ncbi:MAG: transcriptional regulator [bacterium]|nr:transcriptional regulator [bacterium]
MNIRNKFLGKKPHTMVQLTDRGRAAFRRYRESVKQVLEELPE